jgi:hypothetical protein
MAFDSGHHDAIHPISARHEMCIGWCTLFQRLKVSSVALSRWTCARKSLLTPNQIQISIKAKLLGGSSRVVCEYFGSNRYIQHWIERCPKMCTPFLAVVRLFLAILVCLSKTSRIKKRDLRIRQRIRVKEMDNLEKISVRTGLAMDPLWRESTLWLAISRQQDLLSIKEGPPSAPLSKLS